MTDRNFDSEILLPAGLADAIALSKQKRIAVDLPILRRPIEFFLEPPAQMMPPLETVRVEYRPDGFEDDHDA